MRGKALSLVIIDKLPLLHRMNLYLKQELKIAVYKVETSSPDIQIPEAVIALKTRCWSFNSNIDRGAVIICDSRLVFRPYGELFLHSLPNAKRTSSEQGGTIFGSN